MSYISSPLNYTGGKFKLLPQILPLFPTNIDNFVDLFCGGCNVGINVKANKVIFNDSLVKLTNLMAYLKNHELNSILQIINEIINHYNLSQSRNNGYGFYNCDSSKGLGEFNRPNYMRLRDDFNHLEENEEYYYPSLYVLIVYAFNNQIRFNSHGDYNLPVGKRDFNQRMENKFRNFVNAIQRLNCDFTSIDYRDYDYNQLNQNDFVYADPPYLITCATYNESGGWTEEMEQNLYYILDNLDKRKIRFALSNVITSKGKKNEILIRWLTNNPQYRCLHLNKSYSNSNYQTDKNGESDEVLVLNYK